jgi:hypothetical protein
MSSKRTCSLYTRGFLFKKCRQLRHSHKHTHTVQNINRLDSFKSYNLQACHLFIIFFLSTSTSVFFFRSFYFPKKYKAKQRKKFYYCLSAAVLVVLEESWGFGRKKSLCGKNLKIYLIFSG